VPPPPPAPLPPPLQPPRTRPPRCRRTNRTPSSNDCSRLRGCRRAATPPRLLLRPPQHQQQQRLRQQRAQRHLARLSACGLSHRSWMTSSARRRLPSPAKAQAAVQAQVPATAVVPARHGRVGLQPHPHRRRRQRLPLGAAPARSRCCRRLTHLTPAHPRGSTRLPALLALGQRAPRAGLRVEGRRMTAAGMTRPPAALPLGQTLPRPLLRLSRAAWWPQRARRHPSRQAFNVPARARFRRGT
jgi:hypothetical protein